MSVNLLPLLAYTISLLFFETHQQASASCPSGSGSGPSKGPFTALTCNVKLLSALRLSGHPDGERPLRNSVCGIPAKDNCCSQIDEIKILKSFNSYTSPKVNKFADDMNQIYNDFVTIEPYMQNLNASNILYHFDNIAWRKTNESQCFNGKYFLEQGNYDLIKFGNNLTWQIVDAYATLLALNFTNQTGNSIIAFSDLQPLIFGMIFNDTNGTKDMIFSFRSLAIPAWAAAFAANLVLNITALPQSVVTLPPVPPTSTATIFYTNLFQLQPMAEAALRNISSTYFNAVMQRRVSDIHVTVLVNYLTTTLMTTLQNNYRMQVRNVNVSAIINNVADNMFYDPTLRQYLGWFYIPTSRARYIRVYKYCENRFYYLFAQTVMQSPDLNTQAQYAVLKEVMSAITDSSLRSSLWASYARIAGTFVTQLALSNYTVAIFLPTNSMTNDTLYQLMIRDVYSITWSLDPNQALNPDWNTDNAVRGNLQNIANRVNGLLTTPYLLNTNQPNFDARSALTRFARVNLRQARYAEFSGDNKRVCATVYRHSLVREAIFNEQKFSYCLQVTQNYQNVSASAALGPLMDVKTQIQKLLELKGTFYCAACSQKFSKMIDLDSNTIQLNNKFCFEFVQQFNTYLNWRYVIFQNFQSTIYQYLSCYGRNANLTDTFPYPSYDNLMPANFTAWTVCSQVTNIANISLCYPICQAISLTTYAAWIEGDRVNLKRLYDYAIRVLSTYGIQFGTYDPSRNVTSLPAPSGSRLLEETPNRKRSVRINLERDDIPESRRLQSPEAPVSTPASTTGSTSTPGSNSTNTSSYTNMFPANMLVIPENTLLFTILTTVDVMTTYTRPEHYNHDEILSARVNYIPVPAVNDLRNMTSIVSAIGFNPYHFLKRLKFQEFMLKSFYEQTSTLRSESLNRQVIKDCVQVSRKDINLFNSDYNLAFSLDYTEPEKQINILNQREQLFERYRHNISMHWKIMKTASSLNGTGTQAINNQGHRRNLKSKDSKKTKASGKGSFLNNLLFKVLF